MAKKEIYIVTDIESDGPIPGPFSMLSFASVAVDRDGKRYGEFEANLAPLIGAGQHPDTMEFWSKFPEAYQATRFNTQAPEDAIRKFNRWAHGLPGKAVFAAFPAGFDFTFIYWYMVHFLGTSHNSIGFSCLDMKSLAMSIMNSNFRESTKRNMPRSWFGPHTHTHVAIDDARGQADLLVGMFKALKEIHDQSNE